jgi:hypothetical protein
MRSGADAMLAEHSADAEFFGEIHVDETSTECEATVMDGDAEFTYVGHFDDTTQQPSIELISVS